MVDKSALNYVVSGLTKNPLKTIKWLFLETSCEKQRSRFCDHLNVSACDIIQIKTVDHPIFWEKFTDFKFCW